MDKDDERDRLRGRKMQEQWVLEDLERPDYFDEIFDLKRPIALEHAVHIGFEKIGKQVAPKVADSYSWIRPEHGWGYCCLLSEDGRFLIPDYRFPLGEKRRKDAIKEFFC